MRWVVLPVMILILILQPTPTIGLEEGYAELFYRSVTIYAPAVAKTEEGFIGVATTITVTVQNGTGCSGKVFVETAPLTEVDMQGSARLAVSVASSLTGMDASSYDFFFVIKTDAPIIGGPSAGAVMTVATIAALEGWELDNRTMMTGMINPDGSIGPVGGIKEKIDAAYSVGARRFLIPKGQTLVYTTVTRTIRKGGWIKIISERELINVSEYARKKYGIEVIEVEDINDALYYFTGHRFEEGEADKNISTENYTTSMKPLAEYLLSKAEDNYKDASELFNNTKRAIPSYYRKIIEGSLEDSRRTLEQAKDSYDQGLFYSSTSKSFQSLINSRFVTYACNFFSSPDKGRYVKDVLDQAKSLLDAKKRLADNASISGVVSLQCVGAAQKRLFEARNQIEEAENDYMRLDYIDALYRLAFAMERCESVGWWLNISGKFDDRIGLNEDQLNEMVNKYLRLAKNSVVYSQIILQEMGEHSDLLGDAVQLLEEAEKGMEEYPASSLFTSLEALTKANLAIELVGGDEKEKLARTKEKAALEIGECRNYGIEPVLAVSYYEFAEILENESKMDSIVYYRYAQMIAGALRLAIFPMEKRESRFEGIPPLNPSPSILPSMEEILTLILWILAYILVLIAVVVVIASIISRNRRFKREFPPETW